MGDGDVDFLTVMLIVISMVMEGVMPRDRLSQVLTPVSPHHLSIHSFPADWTPRSPTKTREKLLSPPKSCSTYSKHVTNKYLLQT